MDASGAYLVGLFCGSILTAAGFWRIIGGWVKSGLLSMIESEGQ